MLPLTNSRSNKDLSKTSFAANDGEVSGYLAKPEGGQGPGVIVLQERWGLDDHIRRVCDRLADEGFFAVAPDLYRCEPTTQLEEAERRMAALSMEQAEKDMRGAVDHLVTLEGVSGDRVGAIGFFLGSGLAIRAAAADPRVGPVVSYSYLMPHGRPDFSRISGPVLGHFGTADEFVSVEDARALEKQLREAGVNAAFQYHVGAGHSFFNNSDRFGTYDTTAAERSWERTVAFLRDRVNG